ncbi:hypothetical protein [Parageobacillus thermoglucosidasius]|uniref:hypothetical protein n=1 Tax=Parageobacillus thermoglucosidasius TaxID=1426 RepID=UPI0001D170DA|nr:hypothetical protein [Parageobacillus thermoglucosidasius]AEH46776.1 hypothetical protein Geoth_0778 [Parageobacillus thermoglucosidasius C56-YS93]
MAKYIRLQNKKYEINENSKSFEWGYADLHDAMMHDIEAKVEGYIEFEEFDHPIYKQYAAIIEEENEDLQKQMIEEFWEEHCRWGMALPGVSCYRFEEGEEAAEKLYNYFAERDPDALQSDEYYVLIFEGEDTGIDGHNGENVAVWKKDIERVPVTEFFRKYLMNKSKLTVTEE